MRTPYVARSYASGEVGRFMSGTLQNRYVAARSDVRVVYYTAEKCVRDSAECMLSGKVADVVLWRCWRVRGDVMAVILHDIAAVF